MKGQSRTGSPRGSRAHLPTHLRCRTPEPVGNAQLHGTMSDPPGPLRRSRGTAAVRLPVAPGASGTLPSPDSGYRRGTSRTLRGLGKARRSRRVSSSVGSRLEAPIDRQLFIRQGCGWLPSVAVSTHPPTQERVRSSAPSHPSENKNLTVST
jgi:hypothetical protein